MSAGNKVKLNSGYEIPTLGYGTWQSGPGEVKTGVYEALKAGYRHLDFAKVYGNQVECGEGIKQALAEIPGLKREDIFITSKLWLNSADPKDVEPALDDTLKELDLDYLDLYLIHFPVAFQPGVNLFPDDPRDANKVAINTNVSIVDTWKAMTVLPKSKTRSIGVSNFLIDHLQTIIDETGVVPAANQLERHPRLLSPELVSYMKDKNIHLTAYSAFGNNVFGIPLLLEHEKVKQVAANLSAKLGKAVTPAQVILAWSQVGGHSVIPKSVSPSRIQANFQEVALDAESVSIVDSIGEDPVRFNVPHAYTKSWNVDVFGDEKEKGAEYRVKLK